MEWFLLSKSKEIVDFIDFRETSLKNLIIFWL